ncbi:Hypothetical predicted protein [Mytilus galloprovincialis]|uniref:Uncharacterized protein n=1 Tax=Mytilus galloprovincialis TaxID=29158 RepID=A0A8B6F716_MYTGA|nr:Hypothetical predicted protein [Mytilus galloprovincialis]
MKKERKRKVQTKTVKDTDKTKLDKEEYDPSVSSSQLPNDANIRKIVPAFGKKQKLSSTVGREQNGQDETTQSQGIVSVYTTCTVTDADQKLKEDKKEKVVFEDRIPVDTSNTIANELDQITEINSKNCEHLLSSDCADQLVLPSNNSDAMMETDIEISYSPNINRSPVSDTQEVHPDEMSFIPDKIPDEMSFIPDKIPDEMSLLPDKIPDEMSLLPDKIPDEMSILPDKIPDEMSLIPDKIPDKMSLIPDKVPGEMSLIPDKITDDLDDRSFKPISSLTRSTSMNKLVVNPSEIVSTDHANILSKDEHYKMVQNEVENKAENSGNMAVSEVENEIGDLSNVTMKENSTEEKEIGSEFVDSQSKTCSQSSENEIGHFEGTQVFIPEEIEAIEDELTQVFPQLEDKQKYETVDMTGTYIPEAQQTSKNNQSILEIQHNSSFEDRTSANEGKISESCFYQKPMENPSITYDTEITVSDKEAVLQSSKCDLQKVPITSQTLDKCRESEEVTDSQLCNIDWVEDFPLPDKIERKPFLHDGTTVVQGLIRELSQLNTMILRTKREMETTRRQLHQGQASVHTTAWNRNQPLRTFNKH